MFTLVFDPTGFTHTILLWVAALTMVTGVLGAAAQTRFRRILSFHIVSQIGYMVLGLALLTPLALVGAVFYLVHHIIVKANLFLVSGVANRLTGSTELGRIGGLYAAAPLLAVLFLMPAFSLAGFPPLSGFWAKSWCESRARRRGLVSPAALSSGAHHLLDDQDLGRGVLETASRRPRAAPRRAAAARPGALVRPSPRSRS